MLCIGPHPCTQFIFGAFLFWGGQAWPFLYPGHIGLGNRPHMYCTVCQVMGLDLWIELFLLWGGQARSFLFSWSYWIVNWPHMLDNGPYLSPWDVLSLGTFFLLGLFVLLDVLSLGRFNPGTFCPWDVLSLGRFVPGTFCLGTFCISLNESFLLCPCIKFRKKS